MRARFQTVSLTPLSSVAFLAAATNFWGVREPPGSLTRSRANSTASMTALALVSWARSPRPEATMVTVFNLTWFFFRLASDRS